MEWVDTAVGTALGTDLATLQERAAEAARRGTRGISERLWRGGSCSGVVRYGVFRGFGFLT